MKSSRHVIMGLAASGKTTYLAALWHLIEAGEAETGLKLLKAEGDVGYLNKIAEDWRSFRRVERTSQTGDIDVQMIVRTADGSSDAELLFPDLAGESFDVQVEGRKVSEKYVADHAGADGVLLFVTVDRPDELSIAEMNAVLPSEAGGEEEMELVEWDVTRTQVQARLVQVVQDLLDEPFDATPRRLAVILSAWDLVPEPRPKPLDWLRANYPLLEQFIASNADMFEVRVYGVSAQGAPLGNGPPEGFASIPASERIIVQGHGSGEHDLCAPLVWLMTGD